jgi:hypothetical protein
LVTVLVVITLGWLIRLLMREPGDVATRTLATLLGLIGGGTSALIGRAVAWGLGGAIVGFPEDDEG